MSCNLCHEQTGHKPNCSMMIPVKWDVPRSDSSSWEVLCREVFAEWITDSVMENDGDWQRTTRIVQQHIEDGNAYDAYMILRSYRNRLRKDRERRED